VKSVQYYVEPEKSALAKPLSGLFYLIRGIPPDVRFLLNKELMQDLRSFIKENKVDLLQIEDSNMGFYVNALPKGTKVKSVLTFHDINFRKYNRISKIQTTIKRRLRLKLHSIMMRRWEPKIAARFTQCVTMSDLDKELLLSTDPALNVQPIPNGVDTKIFSLLPQNGNLSNHILFVGSMDYSPNVDGVKWFVNNVLPKLDQSMPDYQFWIVGSNPPDEVLALESKKVHVTGFVKDVRPYYESAKIVIVPLFAGGGTRLKILESLALGCPVVSTTIGAEGLELISGQHLLISDTPEDFYLAIKKIIYDHDLQKKLIAQGRERVVEFYDWDAIGDNLEKLYLTITR
jgi:glycosyltransferase involved in cell wall biosynthesis